VPLRYVDGKIATVPPVAAVIDRICGDKRG
jgi:hypothetical protein